MEKVLVPLGEHHINKTRLLYTGYSGSAKSLIWKCEEKWF